MTEENVMRRLDAQDRVLHAILAAVGSTEQEEGAGFDDLVEILSDLTVAVSEVASEVRTLRSTVFVQSRGTGV